MDIMSTNTQAKQMMFSLMKNDINGFRDHIISRCIATSFDPELCLKWQNLACWTMACEVALKYHWVNSTDLKDEEFLLLMDSCTALRKSIQETAPHANEVLPPTGPGLTEKVIRFHSYVNNPNNQCSTLELAKYVGYDDFVAAIVHI